MKNCNMLKSILVLLCCVGFFFACAEGYEGGGKSALTEAELAAAPPFHSLENYNRQNEARQKREEILWDLSSMILFEDSLYVCREMGALADSPEYQERAGELEKRGVLLGNIRRQVTGDQIPDTSFSSNYAAVGSEIYTLAEDEDNVYVKNERVIALYELLEENYRPDNGFDEEGNVIPRMDKGV